MSEVKCNYLGKSKVMNELTSRVYSQIRIGKSKDEVEKIVNNLMKYFDYFNSLDEYSKFVFDNRISIEDVLIPVELSDFIIPASVKRIAGSRICKELLIRVTDKDVESDDSEPMNINNYDNVVSQFRSLFKKDANDNMIKLSDIKLEVSLESIISKISYDGRVRDLGEWYVPIQVTTDNDFKDDYFNNSYDDVVLNYLAYLKFN